MLSTSDCVSANEQQVAAKVMDGEAILINLGTGIYYSLGATGGFIWSLVEKRHSVGDIVRSMMAHYDVGESEATRDVLRLASDLCAEGLATATAAASAPVSPAAEGSPIPQAPTAPRLPYEPPTMEKYTDMAEMFALDPPLPGLSQATTVK
jgi:hypothetical protein